MVCVRFGEGRNNHSMTSKQTSVPKLYLLISEKFQRLPVYLILYFTSVTNPLDWLIHVPLI